MGVSARRLVIAAIAVVGGIALGASLGPTSAFWEDRGGSTMTITAIEEPPPSVNGPVTPGSGTSFTGPTWSGLNSDPDPGPTQFCFTVVINTATEGLSAWTLQMHTTQPPFNNLPPVDNFASKFFGAGGGTFANAPDYMTSGIILATPAGEYQYASLTVSYTAKICATGVPEPAWQPPGPTTYTQREPVQFMRNSTNTNQPCVAATVDGYQPFFVGFTVVFDWKAVLDAELAAARITSDEYNQWITFTHWGGGPPGYFGSQGATGTDYVTTLQGYEVNSRTVSNHAPVTIASCSW